MPLSKAQAAVVAELSRQVRELWRGIDPRRVDETWSFVQPALELAVIQGHDQSVQAALSDYEAARAAAGIAGQIIMPPVELILDAVRTSLRVTGPVALKVAAAQGLSPGQASSVALTQVQGAAARHVLSGGRQTTLTLIREDDRVQGWARVPSATACGFCMMLATRGGVYKSKRTALTSRSGDRYHDFCGCQAVPIFSRDWKPPAHLRRAEEIWKTSTKGLTGKKALQAFYRALADDRKTAAEQTAA